MTQFRRWLADILYCIGGCVIVAASKITPNDKE